MFIRIEPGPDYPELTSPAIVDADRDLLFRSLGSIGQSGLQGFLLRSAQRDIPVQASREKLVRDSRGEHYVRDMIFVGTNATAAESYGVQPYRFASKAEEQEANLLAAECLVAYGWKADGLEAPAGYYRVLIAGREYASADF